MADLPPRTDEEREAARREREAARVEREAARAGQDGAPAGRDGAPAGQDGAPAGQDWAPADQDWAPGEHDWAPFEHESASVEGERPSEGDGDGAGAELAPGRRGRDRRPPRARTRGSRPHRARPHAPHSLVGRIFAVLTLALGIAVIWFCVELFQPFHGSGQGGVTVTIPARSSSSQIGDLLARDHVIDSSFFFDLRATLDGDRGKLLAGTYHLKLGMSYGAVLDVLTTQPPPAPVTEVTIIPGRTRDQINGLLRSQGVSGSYAADSRHSPVLDPATYGAPRSTPSLEGFLFPDTYQLRKPLSIPALVADQLEQFKREFATVNFSLARRHHMTPYDVLIIASMVEAEAATPQDRPLVASVIYNRLADAMPLQIDATTRYATGNYTTPLTRAQLNSNSPYNTRIHRGLTPTPIDSPSLASIEAAADPASTAYLYFVVKPCGNGSEVFASSYTKFEAEVRQYYAVRAAHGGRSPAHC